MASAERGARGVGREALNFHERIKALTEPTRVTWFVFNWDHIYADDNRLTWVQIGDEPPRPCWWEDCLPEGEPDSNSPEGLIVASGVVKAGDAMDEDEREHADGEGWAWLVTYDGPWRLATAEEAAALGLIQAPAVESSHA